MCKNAQFESQNYYNQLFWEGQKIEIVVNRWYKMAASSLSNMEDEFFQTKMDKMFLNKLQKVQRIGWTLQIGI